MLRTVIIGPDARQAQLLEKALSALANELTVSRTVVAYHKDCDASTLREIMRAGVRELVAEPFELSALVESLRNVKTLVEQKPPMYGAKGGIYSFLPAKAGSGATTLALNLSGAISRLAGTRVLLSDLGLSSGIPR